MQKTTNRTAVAVVFSAVAMVLCGWAESQVPLPAVSVGGKALRVEAMRCSAMPVNIRWPGHQRELDQTEICSFARFDCRGASDIVVTPNRPFTNVVVRPVSKKVAVTREGDAVRFTLPSAGAYSVEFDGRHENLMVFADPPRAWKIDRTSPNVRYFGPGEHDVGLITMKPDETLFLDEGAVVYGRIFAKDAPNLRICGRGILDASRVKEVPVEIDPKLAEEQRKKGWAITNVKRFHTVDLHFCDNVRIEGITIRDSQVYAIRPVCCADLKVDNVKILGSWRYNSDGIDMHNCRRVRIRDSFIRTYDDSICVKGFDYCLPESEMLHNGVRHDIFEDVLVERCTIWNDWGRALEIGAETRAREIRNITFRDCDILAFHAIALDVQNCDQAHVHDIVFEKIRVEYDPNACKTVMSASAKDFRGERCDGPAALACAVIHYIPEYSKAGAENRGRTTDVVYRDIDVYAPSLPGVYLAGFDADHRVERVTLERIRLNGNDMTAAFLAAAETNAFAERPISGRPRTARGGNWYKGMLHSHTLLSDGRALPEQAVAAYRDAGYNFFALTDHMRSYSEGETWRYVKKEVGPWPYAVIDSQFENARRRFPKTLRYKTLADGTPIVRLTPFDELQRAFDEPGRFLLLEGVEITRELNTPETKGHVHMNYVNLPGLIPSCREQWVIQTYAEKDWDAARIIRESRAETETFAAAAGNPPYLFTLNHPHWTVLPVQPEHLIDEDRIRFFEIVNNGEKCEAPAPIACGGWENDRFWDIVNAFRCRQGKPLLFAIGSDDTHAYPGTGLPEPAIPSEFGHAGVVVRAAELAPAALVGAMQRGDFYAADGFPTVDDISFEKGTLRVRAIADADETLTIRFIVSKKDFDPSSTNRTVTFASGHGAGTPRTINVYGDTCIGQTVKAVEGRPGEPVEAAYTLAADDLYVRARIESTKTTLNRALGRKSFCPPCRTAWTQPFSGVGDGADSPAE